MTWLYLRIPLEYVTYAQLPHSLSSTTKRTLRLQLTNTMSAPSGIKVPTPLATSFHSALNDASSNVRALVFTIEGGMPLSLELVYG